jgi:outer membrane receptor protein involved in Fe transport
MRLLFFGCFLLLSNLLAAQIIQGTIVDQKTNLPIPDVHVRWVNSLGTISNAQGKFELRRVNGINTIRVSAIGYTTHEEIIGDDSIRIALEPSALMLNQGITITAQRQEDLTVDVPQSVTVVTHEQLLQNAPRTTPEALMNQSGIWVQKTNHGGGSPIIRGLVGNQVLLLVDGIRLNNSTYRYGPNQYLNTIDPGVIERMEAIRGSGSVLYGSDALGGVVQVISKVPSFSLEKTNVSANIIAKWMSQDMEQSGRAEVEIGSKRIAFLGGFSERNFGELVAGGELGTLSPTGYHERAADAKMLVRTGSSGMLTAAFQQVTQSDVPRYDQVTQGGFSMYTFDPQLRQLSYLRWEIFSNNRLAQSIRITGSYNRSVEGTLSQKTNSPTIKNQRDEVNTAGFIAEIISKPTSQWNAQSGIEYYFDNVGSTATELNTTTQAETSVRGSYADGSTLSNLAIFTNHQFDWRKFQFTSGLRFNTVTGTVEDATFGNQKINPSAWVGNLGVIYKISPRLRAIFSGNTGFRAPNVDDMSKFGAVEATVFEIPSSELAPEKSFTLETGFKFNGKKYSGALTAYRTQLSDLIDRVPATYQGSSIYDGKNVYQKQNVGEALVKGVEVEGEISLFSTLSAYGNLTYTYGDNKTKQEPMRRIPPLFGRLGLQYRNSSGWWLKGELAMAGEQDRLAAGDLSDVRISSRLVDGVMPGWNCLTLYAGYQYKSVRIQTSFINLLDKAYRIYASGVDEYGRCVNVMLMVYINRKH